MEFHLGMWNFTWGSGMSDTEFYHGEKFYQILWMMWNSTWKSGIPPGGVTFLLGKRNSTLGSRIPPGEVDFHLGKRNVWHWIPPWKKTYHILWMTWNSTWAILLMAIEWRKYQWEKNLRRSSYVLSQVEFHLNTSTYVKFHCMRNLTP